MCFNMSGWSEAYVLEDALKYLKESAEAESLVDDFVPILRGMVYALPPGETRSYFEEVADLLQEAQETFENDPTRTDISKCLDSLEGVDKKLKNAPPMSAIVASQKLLDEMRLNIAVTMDAIYYLAESRGESSI